MKLEKVLYKAHANVTGGRQGHGRTSDGVLDVNLTTPKEMGGDGAKGTNPEQLFAVGYSACFLGALRAVARGEKVAIPPDANIEGTVGFGALPKGYGVEVELKISIPGLDRKLVESLVEKAHQICPYSNATRGNIDVTLKVV